MDQFPAGLRILVVDDDRAWLKLLEHMLRKCLYHVTTCYRATIALSLLREKKDGFDLVISDVHMPDMDGYKLLEHVGLEMDLPVIMMSGDERTSAVMRGIRHGACDYLIKPVRMEELKNIWQHVVRKKWNGNKEHENSGSIDDSDRQKRGIDDAEYASSVNDGTDSNWKGQKKKRESREDEDDGELDNDDPSASKKPRVVWSVELHQQFVNAVNQLGIDKAVPKRILELMNVPGLTRENVASHLQKFRLYLKRLSGVSQHQGGQPNTYSGPGETSGNVSQLGSLEFQALAASGRIPQTLAAALHAELLGRPSSSMMLSGLDQSALLQTSVPGPSYVSMEHGVGYNSQPLVKCPTNIAKQLSQNNVVLEDVSSGLLEWSANSLGTTCSTSNVAGLNNLQNNNMLAQILPQKQSQPVLSESSHAVNVQPSCLIIPSHSSGTYQVGNIPTITSPNPLLVSTQASNSYQTTNSSHTNQNPSFGNCQTMADYRLVSSQSSTSSLCVGQVPNGQHLKSSHVLNGYSIAGPLSSPMSSGLPSAGGNNNWRLPNFVNATTTSVRLSGLAPNMGDLQGSLMNTGMFPNRGEVKNLGFVGKGTCIPSRLAVDDIESLTENPGRKKANNNANGTVNQEIQLDFAEGSRRENASHFSASDFMSVISK